jgi:hypothetical protein
MHVVIRVRLLVITSSTPIPIALLLRRHRWRMRRRRYARQAVCWISLVDGLPKAEIPEHIVPIPQVIWLSWLMHLGWMRRWW